MKTATPIRPTAESEVIPWGQIKGWFFDLDGTLMDTDDQVVERIAARLSLLGPQRARNVGRQLVMKSETWINAMVTLLDILGLDSWVFAVRHQLSRQVAPTFRLIQGVKPLLQTLTDRGGVLAVVSTRPTEDAEAFLRQHDLASFFELIVAQETTKRLKPHPEPIRYAARFLNLPIESCVMVGDTPVDVRSASRAGAWAVGVLCGFGEAHELELAGADCVLEKTADLLPLIEERPSDQSDAVPARN
jgi:HAD superfamily hydrolase (TIGR01509 family)